MSELCSFLNYLNHNYEIYLYSYVSKFNYKRYECRMYKCSKCNSIAHENNKPIYTCDEQIIKNIIE